MDSKKNEFFINLEVWRMLWNYLGTIGGKTLLKEEMLNNINTIVNEAIASSPDTYPEAKKNNVKKLFFTSFVFYFFYDKTSIWTS